MKYYFLLLSILLASCSFGSDNVNEIKKSETHVIDLPNLIDSTYFYYSNVFSDVNYIVLESGPESALGSVSQLNITNSGDIIAFDRANKIILRFDSCGHFLNQIGLRGHGRNEYVDPLYMSYDQFNDKILVSDMARHNLLIFNTNGKVDKVVKNDIFYNSSFCVLDSCHLLFYSNYKHEDECNYHITDYDGKVVSRFETSIDTKVFRGYPDCSEIFSFGNGDVWCRSLFSSRVYNVTDSVVSLKYEFVDKNGVWAIGDPQNLKNVKRNPIELATVGIVNNKVFIACVHKGKWYSYSNDLKGHEYAGIYAVNDVHGFVSTAGLSFIKNNKIYKMFSSIYFEQQYDYLKNRQNSKPEDLDFLLKMSQVANPIIQVCTVKD